MSDQERDELLSYCAAAAHTSSRRITACTIVIVVINTLAIVIQKLL